jgi:hypothetical protein
LKCKTCGKNADSEYCFAHKPKKPLAQSKFSSPSRLRYVLSANRVEKAREMHEFFLSIWKERTHFSEISGRYLGSEAMSIYFHHILPKEKYPEATLDEENIILLTLDEHTNVEGDMYKYEEVNNRRNQLKIKYEKSVLLH